MTWGLGLLLGGLGLIAWWRTRSKPLSRSWHADHERRESGKGWDGGTRWRSPKETGRYLS